MVKKFFKRVMLYDRRTGNVKKVACVCGVLVGFGATCFAQGKSDFDTSAVTGKLSGFIGAIATILKIVTGGMVLIGGFSVGSAYMNDKQNAPDTLKKWIIGIGISFCATAFATMASKNMEDKVSIN